MDQISNKSFVLSGSESKMGFVGDGERLDLGHKRIKMKDLDSVFSSQSKGFAINATSYYASQKEMFRANIETVTMNSDVTQSVERKKHIECTALDLNASVDLTSVSAPECAYRKNNLTLNSDMIIDKSKGFGFDLNVEDVSSSANYEPVCPNKHIEQIELRDDLECGSTCSAVEVKDPMKVWKEMKQNGFMSSSHGGIPIPKRRGRKNKAEVLKKKMESARREQVDRFAKIAAPSGLLNGLNPGIINHVRNSKQVHSIIEALVRSERRDSFHNGNNEEKILTNTERIESSDDSRNLNFLEIKGYNLFHENGSLNNASTIRQTSHCAVRDNNASSMNTSTLCDEDSTDLSSVSSLSFKAANVASQWLELLQHDINGRLGALRRSKKRVRSVIQTDLPLLISREFSHNQQNDLYVTKIPVPSSSVNATANLHKARWSTLFNQMENALSDEERQLENWLSQVKEMQTQYGCGLSQCTGKPGMQQLGTSETEYRIENSNDYERVLAVRAAAAAFYSTCNFSQSAGNLPCF
ncbi:hypothetical protein POM88_000397 [Heracleum sosnowskyi]|uniref:Cation-transporting ATPase n=1 Tax=Heracleum sosnowskyi TaxID=360622 RepID=A0AAD8JAP1_9APIA|nr:hypothetical protein POM88_000397 [Heracleum sosnowskyi]